MIHSLILWIVFTILTLWTAGIVLITVNLTLRFGLAQAKQEAIYELFVRFWARAAFWLVGVRISGEGLDILVRQRGPFLVMSNHQSYLDPPLMIALSPVPLRFVAKNELLGIPLFGAALVASGHVLIDRSDRERAIESMQRAIRKIGQRPLGIVVYPEGTRVDPPEMGEFKKGGFMMALDGGIPIIPMAIHGTSVTLRQNSFRVNRSVSPSLRVGQPIDARAYGHERRDELIRRVRDDISALRGEHPC